ncbi:MAG TPA: coniferyl aldehyde dehydrogenase [Roseiarcus sp.]|nr:coniferyl aldehyde dehydrogenase [Roseiarcus sp.]
MNDIAVQASSTDAAEGVSRIFLMQRVASRAKTLDLAARLDALGRLRALTFDNAEAIARAISEDFGGRSHDETRLLELAPTLSAIRHARKNLSRWMRARRRRVDIAFQPARAWVRYEPLGVVAVMAPWNYPLLLTLTPACNALAAGNRVMVKPSELAPRFAGLLQRLIAERFKENELAVVTGGPEVAEAFANLPFDHLIFTGSTSVGRKVMAAAASNLTPLTLELGGKSPVVVCPDYPIEKAAHSIALGKFVNAGQTCIAPDYVLAPSPRVEALAAAVMAEARAMYPTIGANVDYTSLISEKRRQSIDIAIQEAEAMGAKIVRHEDNVEGTRKIGPTIVLNAPMDCLLMREEIFGPVLPIVGYDELDAAIRFVNGRDRPLALYCFSNDEALRDRVLNGATSGGVTLNGALLHIAQDNLPFGGVGASGFGAYHGEEGFRRFSHARAVHQVGPINVFEKLGPPWGRLARLTANFLMKR